MSGGLGTTHNVVLIGGGTVGAATVELLRRSGVEIGAVLVRDASRPRAFAGWQDLVTTDAAVLAGADLVVEVAGGTTTAADHALEALGRGARLVTANKAALAERWDDFAPHLRAGLVWCEAAVMAGTPVVGALTHALSASAPVHLHAVLNGTCNVILSDMEAGVPFEQALASAQAAGFAEADPTLDVEGFDAAHKAVVLARLAFDPDLDHADALRATTGVTGLDPEAVRDQARRGHNVRLVASVYPGVAGWSVAVRPMALPAGHPLVTHGPVNAAVFVGVPGGEVVWRGHGAGGGATATAVASDVLSALAGGRGHAPRGSAADHVAAMAVAGDGAALPVGATAL